MPTIYLDGMAACFASLARQFNGSERNGTAEQPQTAAAHAQAEFASLEDAQYVQAVIEAVRASSREKTWTKVIRLKPPPAAKEDEKAKAAGVARQKRRT